MRGCPLVVETFGTLGLCDRCGKPLPPMKCGQPNPNRRWCSQVCSDAYWNDHSWGSARRAALKRDGYQCVKCGDDAGTRHRCYGCSGDWPCPKAGETYRHTEWVTVGALEVNHIDPRKGGGYANGCAHHLDGLETLCRPCHVGVTTAQLREWKHPNAQPRTRRLSEAEPLSLWDVA